MEVIGNSKTMTNQDLMKKYDAGVSTIHKIIDRSSKLTNEWLTSHNSDLKNKLRKTKHEQVNETTLN